MLSRVKLHLLFGYGLLLQGLAASREFLVFGLDRKRRSSRLLPRLFADLQGSPRSLSLPGLSLSAPVGLLQSG